MPRPFIRMFLVGPGHPVRLPVEAFLVIVIETEKPGGAIDGFGTHHVVHMSMVPALFTPLLPGSGGIDRGLVDPDKFRVRQGQKPRLARSFL